MSIVSGRSSSRDSVITDDSCLNSFCGQSFRYVLYFITQRVGTDRAVTGFLPGSQCSSSSSRISRIVICRIRFQQSDILHLHQIQLAAISRSRSPHLPLPRTAVGDKHNDILRHFLASVIFIGGLINLMKLSLAGIKVLRITFQEIIQQSRMVGIQIVQS